MSESDKISEDSAGERGRGGGGLGKGGGAHAGDNGVAGTGATVLCVCGWKLRLPGGGGILQYWGIRWEMGGVARKPLPTLLPGPAFAKGLQGI